MNNLHLSILDAEEGRLDEARRRLVSAVGHYRGMGFLQYGAECLESASAIATGMDAPAEAGFFLGAAARMRELSGSPPVPFMAALRERETILLRQALGDETAEAALQDGRDAAPDAAMERAVAFLSADGSIGA